ncbi:MAG: response regulator [Oscillospiraceae bacterium]|nr:response regulator [Oscillospiraceae bacterium]
MAGRKFELTEDTLSVIEEIGGHMPGGLFIYKAEEPGELIYVNQAVFDIYGCADSEEFRELTGFTFRGMVHPEDYDRISVSIASQISSSADQMDYAEYRITRRDGKIRWVDDYGHFCETKIYGGIYVVFVSDITEKREQRETDKATRDAVISTLTNAYNTVWLISDVVTEKSSLYHTDLDAVHAEAIRNALSHARYTDTKTEYVATMVAEEDQERMQEQIGLPYILKQFETKDQFSVGFLRALSNGARHYRIDFGKVFMPGGRIGVMMGFKDVDDEIQRDRAIQEALEDARRTGEEYRQAAEESITYGKVAQALAGDYFSIYIVDPDTERFTEYSATKEYDRLGLEKRGDNFFSVSRKNMNRLIFSDDRERFLGTFYKEKVMSILERDGSFTMKYRLMTEGDPFWVSMKATLLEDRNGRHLIIGTNNIDAQMKRELEYQKHVAEARTSARNDFLANMSHDIRTPMNAIVGYTNIAKSSRDDPDKVTDALDKIGSSSHFLLSLINDILDISKIESGKMQLNCAPCDLNVLFRRIEDITALQARNKSLLISYSHDSVRHCRVHADELRIEQILINIISNAIKYTPAGKTVDLIAEELPAGEGGASSSGNTHTYRFIIRDTGIGISDEYLPYIFESFTREEKTTVNRIQGTGLGLAITAKIVELMGGRISVRSTVREGSEFTVELELESLEEEDAEEHAADDGFSLTGCRVLLVEDNDINAEIAAMVLEQYGVETDRAENGQIGLDLVREHGEAYYDAVLMDIQMPVMNGYEATRAIRALDGECFKSLPIIAMSANAYNEDVRNCLDAGMNAHIAKPFNPELLMKQLQEQIRKKPL